MYVLWYCVLKKIDTWYLVDLLSVVLVKAAVELGQAYVEGGRNVSSILLL